MSKPAAINRLLNLASGYKVKLIKNGRVKPGWLEINIHPSDYEKDGGDSLQIEVFDKLSKTYLLVDSTGNVSAFIEMWKKNGFKAAVEGLKQKYRFPVTPVTEEKKLLQKIDDDIKKINYGVSRLLNHFAIEDPKPPVPSPKIGGRTEEKTDEGGEGSKANGKNNGNGKGKDGNGNDGNGNGKGKDGNGNGNGNSNVDDWWWDW